MNLPVLCLTLASLAFTFSSQINAQSRDELPNDYLTSEEAKLDVTAPNASAWPRNIRPLNEAVFSSAPCRQDAPTTDLIYSWYRDVRENSVDRRNELVFGISFEDEDAKMIEDFKVLVQRRDILNTIDERKRPPRFRSRCTNVWCAVQHIFGDRKGPQLLAMLGVFGFNASYRAYRGSVPKVGDWKEEELDLMFEVLMDFPRQLYPIPPHTDRQYGTPFIKINGRAGGIIANAVIYVWYKTWRESDPWYRTYVLFHELAHNFDAAVGKKLVGKSLSDTEEWLSFSGWPVSDGDFGSKFQRKLGQATKTAFDIYDNNLAENAENIVSVYGMTLHDEDFAESVVAYRYNPELLMARSPEKYKYLRTHVFSGIEYTSEDLCKDSWERL